MYVLTHDLKICIRGLVPDLLLLSYCFFFITDSRVTPEMWLQSNAFKNVP